MLGLGIIIGLALYGAYLTTRCTFRVEEGHLGVLVTFGAAEFKKEGGGKRLVTHNPGLHFKWPWQKVIIVSMMEQNLDLSGEEGGRSAMAEDGTILRFDSILRYEPMEEELAGFLFGLKSPIEHITGLFTCLLRNEIANFRSSDGRSSPPGSGTDSVRSPEGRLMFVPTAPGMDGDFTSQAGSYALIRRERQRLNRNIEQFSRSQIGARYGVRFNAVDLVDILPPDELADALNAVIQTQTEAEAHYFRAQADCQQRILSAERGVEIARSRALAIEKEIDILGQNLMILEAEGTLEAYVMRRRAEVLSEARTTFFKDQHSEVAQ